MAMSPVPPSVVSADLLIGLARIAGVELTPERASTLVAQAIPHFGLMNALDALDPRGAEIAPEFRLDQAESVR